MSRSSPLDVPEPDLTAPGRVCASLPDFLGRTALPLLAALPTAARVLFLVDARRAMVNRARVSDSEFMSVPTGAAGPLPFGDRTIDCVVLDAVQLEAGLDKTPGEDGSAAILQEVRRVLQTDGELVLVSEYRRLPHDWRQLRRYRLVPPDRRWTERLTAEGYRIAATSYIDLDDLRLTRLRRSADSAEEPKSSGYKVLRCVQNPEEPPKAVLDTILEEVSAQLTSGVRDVQRIAIRKIGKTSITVADRSGRRYMIRVPRSAVAAARARRNYAALQAVSSDDRLPPAMRNLVPRPILSMRVADYDCYVEEVMAGSELEPSLPAGEIWHGAAVDFITALHTCSKFAVMVDEAVYQNSFAEPLETVRRYCGPAWAKEAIDRLVQSIRPSVEGQTLALAWTHGDFFPGNCLSNPAGELTGVVDWELFSTAGLPLLDLLQCMVVPGETSSHPTWQRFDRICGFISAPSDLSRWPAVARYLDMMEVPPASVPALLRMYWVDHVANRIAARCTDPIWMQKRVYQPLHALNRLESAACASAAEHGR